jgi:hypothetical protein
LTGARQEIHFNDRSNTVPNYLVVRDRLRNRRFVDICTQDARNAGFKREYFIIAQA